MIKIYHNLRCKKSRAGLAFIEEKKLEFEKILYLKDQAFTAETFTELLKKLGMKPQEILRTQEKLYRQEYKNKEMTDTELVKVMVDNPRFIKRPIFEIENVAVWGDPPENIDSVLA